MAYQFGALPNKTNKLLKTKQKLALCKVYNLKTKDHTHQYFQHAHILKFNDLFELTTICYIQSGLHHTSPKNIQKLWSVRETDRPGLRSTQPNLNSHNNLLPNGQARLWNNNTLQSELKPSIFKAKNKTRILQQYQEETEDIH